MTRFEFFYDYASPFSYLADVQLAGLCERTGAELVRRPVLLGGIFKATGNRSPMEEPVPAKRAYGGVVLRRWVERVGAPFQPNPHFPINTLALMRSAHAAIRADVFDAFHAAVFPAFWAQGRNLGDPAVISDVLREAGLDAEGLLEASGQPPVKQALRAATDEAVERGAFGVPTFFVGDEMFFGNDHMSFVEDALVGGA